MSARNFWWLALLLFAPAAFAQAPSETPAELLSFQARELFLDEDFAGLERMADEFRRSKARLPDGTWKLAAFYSGVEAGLTRHVGTERAYRATEEKVARWAKAFPRSASPPIVLSAALSDHGWYYRGGGFANTVSAPAMRTFEELVERAGRVLDDAKAYAKGDPEWYASRLSVARDEGWSRAQFTATFDEATAREPLYVPLYYRAADDLLPKWGGSVEEIDALANRAVALTRSTERESMYAVIYWYVAREFKNIFEETPAKWPRMSKGFDDLMAIHPDAATLNAFARFACLAHDKDKTRALLERIGDKPLLRMWVTDANYSNCVAWVAT